MVTSISTSISEPSKSRTLPRTVFLGRAVLRAGDMKLAMPPFCFLSSRSCLRDSALAFVFCAFSFDWRFSSCLRFFSRSLSSFSRRFCSAFAFLGSVLTGGDAAGPVLKGGDATSSSMFVSVPSTFSLSTPTS